MADLRRMTAMRRGDRYGFTRPRGTGRIRNRCTKARSRPARAAVSVVAGSVAGSIAVKLALD
jgi:hypothetical protein